jgi:hypothetical protein
LPHDAARRAAGRDLLEGNSINTVLRGAAPQHGPGRKVLEFEAEDTPERISPGRVGEVR